MSALQMPLTGTAQAWATTTLAPSDAVRTSDLFIDDKGMFHLVYVANDREIGYSTSMDGGDTWSNPVIVYSEERSDAAPIAPKIAVDRARSVFICWTATSEAASLEPGGRAICEVSRQWRNLDTASMAS